MSQASASPNGQFPAPIGVPLLDVQRQYRQLEPELNEAIAKVCHSGRFILGPDCEALEQGIAKYCQVKHAIACASGSDALLLALMAYEIGAGDEVILPSYTFFATAGAVWRLGARPVFVDIDPDTYNLDPAHLATLVTSRTKAVIPVHLFGQTADMDAILKITQPRGIPVIEDACQAIGAEWHSRRVGGLGDIACFSFYPTKNLGCFGDGGMLTTQDDQLAKRLRLLRAHGMEPRYYHQLVGVNSRLDTMQAAILNVKLPHLDHWTEQRQINAERYEQFFLSHGLKQHVGLPQHQSAHRHVWNQYVIRIGGGQRDALRQHLTQQRIGSEIYYPLPLHRQECFQSLGYGPGSLPHSERAAEETIALPIFPELTAAEQRTVVESIGSFFGVAAATPPSTVAGPNFLRHPAAKSRNKAG